MNREAPPLLDRGAAIIEESFTGYMEDFRALTRGVRARFERRDWFGIQRDSVARLDLYKRAVQEAVATMRQLLRDRTRDQAAWRAFKAAYFERIADRPDAELAETFFNSVSRRVFTTIGVDPDVEFVEPQASPPLDSCPSLTETFVPHRTLRDLVRAVLDRYRFSVPFEDLETDAGLVAAEIEMQVPASRVRAIELARPVFFRNKAAYLVGRLQTDTGHLPIVLALLNNPGGVTVDAVLLTEDEVSIVFSFTRSYFLVDADRPGELVAFLHAIMPRKPIAELYTSIGHNKHGKTELYRALLRHLDESNDCFELARGARGMVMIVFTMPSWDVIFKVFRDRFDYPKSASRQDVMGKYQLVFKHDRAGRLVDAQEFEYLKFDRARFSEPLLRELTTNAAETVAVEGDSVVLRHLYTERRLVPLDLYLREADEAAARHAVLDYGAAIRDLAATNIFPGDLLLKNFGVTRHGRLVFYDYDELCLLTDCNFRKLPEAAGDEEEMAGEPWYYVGEADVFPEEFLSFLGFPGPLRELFLAAHGDLLDVDFWLKAQEAQRARRVLDIFPYQPGKRLRAG